MGEIKKQGINNTLFMYLGIVVGFVNTLFIQPQLLSTSEIGLTKVLFSFSMLFATLLPMGAGNITLRYFPRFKDDETGHHGFLGLVTGITLSGFILYGVILYFLTDYFISVYQPKSPEFANYFSYVYPFGLALALIGVFNTFCNGNFKSSFPTFLNDVLARVLLIFLIFLYFWGWIDFGTYVKLFVTVFILQAVLVIYYISTFSKLNFKYDWSFMGPKVNKEILIYGLTFLLSSVASMGLKTLDITMLAMYLPLSAVGIYGIVSVIPLMIEAPLNSLERIAAPKVTEAMTLGNKLELEKIYKQSSHYLLLIGGWLFLMINLNIHDFLSVLKPEYAQGATIVVILSVGNFINMATGVNNPFVYYSDHYKTGVAILLFMVVVAFVNYLIFIPIWGLEGAAFATVISNLVMNIAKSIVIKIKFGILPFNASTVPLFSLTLLCWVAIFIPMPHLNPFLLIAVRSLIISIIYISVVLWGKLSPEMVNIEQIRKLLRL